MTTATNRRQARVAVVGLGAITSQGATADDLWHGVEGGKVAIHPVQHLSMDGFRTAIAGEVQAARKEWTPPHDVGYPDGLHDRALDFALTAAGEAMRNAGIDPTATADVLPDDRWGVVLGTCNAGLLSGEQWYLARERGERPDPRLLMFVPPQALAEAVAGAFGLRGPVLSIDTACAAGANAIGYAGQLIRSGRADAVVTGGTDALSDVLVSGFNSLESLSPEPAAPYSKDRLGLSLGEGSGMIVLVRADIAGDLGLPVLAELAGYGLSADGYHPTAPHPEGLGASRAIKAALRSAGLAAEDVRYVNSHGTGTAKNDPAETLATKVGLGDAAKSVAVSSTKSMIGHLLGAAGAVEAIVTVKALQLQVAPPTANFTEPDPDCDLDYVPNASRPVEMTAALSNNFAFGGANATIALTRRREDAPPAPAAEPVVVTGLAALTPAGTDPGAAWDSVNAGRDCTVAEGSGRVGRVELDVKAFLTPKERRRMDRLGIFAVVSSRLALADAGLELDEGNRERVGVVLGTGIGPMEAMENFSRPLFAEGPRAANPGVFPNTVYNAAAGQVSMRLGAVGPTTTVTAGHAAGASALAYAMDLLATDQADAMLAVACDTLTDTVVEGYQALGAAGEDGFALAEAGVAVLLERRSSALARGARIAGTTLGYGIAADGRGTGRWDVSGRGLERAVRLALEDAGLSASDIETVWTAAAGLKSADAAERAALNRVFGTGESPVRQAPKLLLGEPIGVGPALGTVLAAEGWARGEQVGPALVIGTSLGGTHFAIVVAPPEGAG